MRFFDALDVQKLILDFPNPDLFVQDTGWRALRSDNNAIFNSRDALRLAMVRDVIIATMYEHFSEKKIVFNYGVFMAFINDNERHYNLVSQELSWLTQTFCTRGENWELRISNTPDAWRNILGLMLGGTLCAPFFQKTKAVAGGGDGNFYDPDRPLYSA